jgi:hypothetical protein
MVFRKDEKRPELDIMDIRPGQNLEQNWYSGTDQVHINVASLRVGTPACE